MTPWWVALRPSREALFYFIFISIAHILHETCWIVLGQHVYHGADIAATFSASLQAVIISLAHRFMKHFGQPGCMRQLLIT